MFVHSGKINLYKSKSSMPKGDHLKSINVPAYANLRKSVTYNELTNFKSRNDKYLSRANISEVEDIGVKGKRIIPNKIFEQMCTKLIIDRIGRKKLSE